MLYVSKAALDTIVGANFARQDLSPVIGLLTTRPRPVTQFAPKVKATNTIHQWVEQGRNPVGPANATYAQGALPGTQAIAPVRPQNITCRTGVTAQVTDDEAAVWSGAGSWKLQQGEEERLMQEAIDLQVELATLDVLDQLEWMHIQGDSTNPQAMSGGQTDGLIKWITASGIAFATGGTSAAAATFTEQMVKDAARLSAEAYPTLLADTMLIPPELQVDINSFVGGGAGRPITQIVAAGPDGTQSMVGGNSVGFYNTGYSVVKIALEPSLSPLFNASLLNPAVIMYNKANVKHASLIDLAAEPLARTDTSVKKMVTTVYAQEHRVPPHASILSNIKSAIL